LKWVLRIFGSIIGLFALAALAGFFASPNVSVERSIDVFAQPEDVFYYLENLEDHYNWSPWHNEETVDEFIVGGADSGVGQRAAWTCSSTDCLPGTQEISVLQYPEFVQAQLNLGGRSADATYALMSGENSDGSLTILFKVDMQIGDFPYVQRLFKFRERAAMEQRLDKALDDLTVLIKEDGKSD